MASAERLANPILNSPYFPPEAHFELGPSGPTGEVLPGRRPSESFVPVPVQRKGTGKVAEQVQMDFDVTGERRETNTLINDIRREVERWRASDWNGVTPYSRKLLAHWAPGSHRDDPVLFSSGRRRRRPSSSPRWRVDTEPLTTAAGWSRRTRSTTTACLASGSRWPPEPARPW
jgi:hypothetical protein